MKPPPSAASPLETPGVKETIELIRRKWPQVSEDAPDRPVFVFAAGWRSGSTLLQRLIASGGEILMWGEPYQHSAFVQLLAEGLRPMAAKGDYAFGYNDEWYMPLDPSEAKPRASRIRNEFEANLYPHPLHLARAHREFFRAWFGVQASSLGFERWGFKETQLSMEHAVYLKWLFPRSKIIFLYRDPYLMYQSYKPLAPWVLRWPNDTIDTLEQFGAWWKSLLSGYLEGYRSVDGMLVKLEDLSRGAIPVSTISDFVEAKLDPTVLEKKIRMRNAGPDAPSPATIDHDEMLRLKAVVDPLATQLGYQPRL
jgi:hypothetical protein